jgi:serine phosphatase RsbU (regulator of sigma subunit)
MDFQFTSVQVRPSEIMVAQQAEQLRELERQRHLAELANAQQQLEADKHQQESHAAGQVQQMLFSRQAPPYPGYDIAGVIHPADATGDYFDYIASSEGCPDIVIQPTGCWVRLTAGTVRQPQFSDSEGRDRCEDVSAGPVPF